MPQAQLIIGDCIEALESLSAASVQMCVTSPPYWGLRDYGTAGQLGAEETPAEYVRNLVNVFAAVKRVLKDDGTLWLNLGDTYAANRSYQVPSTKGGPKHAPAQGFRGSAMRVPEGLKEKDLIGIPWRVAFALQEDGWYLRSDIIWEKPNAMPESVKDRPTRCHEYLFLLAKSPKYYYDADAVREPTVPLWGPDEGFAPSRKDHHITPQSAIRQGKGRMGNNPLGRNKRTVWSVNTKPYKGAHVAPFPEALVAPCIKAGSSVGDIVLDPFLGSGTSGKVALDLGRNFIGIDINSDYVALARGRMGIMEEESLAG